MLIFGDGFGGFPRYEFATKLTRLLGMTTVDHAHEQTSLHPAVP
jgi:hypothetical protein